MIPDDLRIDWPGGRANSDPAPSHAPPEAFDDAFGGENRHQFRGAARETRDRAPADMSVQPDALGAVLALVGETLEQVRRLEIMTGEDGQALMDAIERLREEVSNGLAGLQAQLDGLVGLSGMNVPTASRD